MFRPHNESGMHQSNYHEQNPFFRETITIIDQCTKLMKDDRIFLRNKIKDYLKELKQNRQKEDEWEDQQMQILLQLFIQGNRKKSLNKIQKGDKVMDWLQIKLRKFIDSNKKQKHKKDVQSFRRIKGINHKKQNGPNISFDESLEKSRGFQVYNGPKFADQVNKLSFNVEPRKKTTLSKYSLSKSNQKYSDYSRRKISQKEPFSNESFYKQFDYLKKTQKKQKQEPIRQTSSSLLKNKYLRNHSHLISSQLAKLNRSLDNQRYAYKLFDRKRSNKSRQKDEINVIKDKNLKQIQIPEQLTKHQLDKLTELFTHHLNSQEKSKKNTSNNSLQSHFRFPQSSKKSEEIPQYRLPSDSSYSQRQANILYNSHRYEASTKKIQEMLRNSKQILYQYQQQYDSKYKSKQPLPEHLQAIFPKNSSYENLFTPPDFLAECRKYMFSSNKKKTEQDVYDKYNQLYKQSNFSDLLNESKQRNNEKIYKLNLYGINEAVSENASANLSKNKPESQVTFQLKNYSIVTIEVLILQIFKFSNKASLDRFQLGQIMSKSNPQTEQLFQKYCDVLYLQSVSYRQNLSFDFVSVVKYFYTLGKILQPNRQYFCIFLSQILDIRKKGYIDADDIQNFFESLQISDLDQGTLNTIHTLLYRVFKDGCQVESGNMTTHWSIYYLELKGDQSLLSLKELLNKFQFQLDQQNDQ